MVDAGCCARVLFAGARVVGHGVTGTRKAASVAEFRCRVLLASETESRVCCWRVLHRVLVLAQAES